MAYIRLPKVRWLIFASVLAVLLVGVACGEDATEEPTTAPVATTPAEATTAPVATTAPATTAAATTAPGPAPTATPTTAPEPTPDAMPKAGAKLTFALNNFGNERINPNNATKEGGMGGLIHMSDFLMGVTPDNVLSNAWGWADSWEQVDGATWDIIMKDYIVDHDGFEVDAEDCVWITNHWASDEGNSPGGAISPGWRVIFDRTEALDKYHCRIHLKQNYAFVFNILPPIGGADLYAWPKRGYVEIAGGDDGKFEEIGAPMTGFAKFVERRLGQYWRLERFDDYYADEEFHFKFREMETLLAAEDAPRLALVKTGVADIANMSGPYVEEIRASGLVVDGPEKVDIVYQGFYQTYDPGHCTNKLEVRKAMNLAVDADAIMAGLWPVGTAERAITAFTSPHDESWNPALQPYGYDPDEARRLLEESGCAGFKFISYGYAFAQGPEMRDMTDAIVTYLQGVGIDADFVPIDPVPITQKRLEEKFGAARRPAGERLPLAARGPQLRRQDPRPRALRQPGRLGVQHSRAGPVAGEDAGLRGDNGPGGAAEGRTSHGPGAVRHVPGHTHRLPQRHLGPEPGHPVRRVAAHQRHAGPPDVQHPHPLRQLGPARGRIGEEETLEKGGPPQERRPPLLVRGRGLQGPAGHRPADLTPNGALHRLRAERSGDPCRRRGSHDRNDSGGRPGPWLLRVPVQLGPVG